MHMNRDDIVKYVSGLHPELQVLYVKIRCFVRDYPEGDTADPEFQIAAALENVFQRFAERDAD